MLNRILLLAACLCGVLVGCAGPREPRTQVTDQPAVDTAQARLGRALMMKFGCHMCHLDDGPGIGPPLRRLTGKSRRFDDGSSGIADANYLRESILAPQRHIVDGYDASMPSFAGRLDEDQLAAILAAMR